MNELQNPGRGDAGKVMRTLRDDVPVHVDPITNKSIARVPVKIGLEDFFLEYV